MNYCVISSKKYVLIGIDFMQQFSNMPGLLILISVISSWQESLSFCRMMLLVSLLCGLFIICYAQYQREFLPDCPSMQNREQPRLKKTQAAEQK